LTSFPFQAGLLSAVLAAFVVPKIQDMKENPADKSAYYQQQSVQLLDRISQQFASVDGQISTNYTPLPYPTFHPSASDRRVNIIWLISLVCSLSATLLATFIQQWARAYMRALQHSGKPLKAARIHLFLSEGAQRVPTIAEFVPGLIHISLILFFWGLGDLILQIDKTIFITTVVPILVCLCLYFYCAFAPIWNPQLPYWTPLSPYIWRLIQILRRNLHYRTRAASVSVRDLQFESMEEYRGQFALEQTEVRKDRDVRALQWLINNINGDNEMRSFVLAIPGSFNQEWGRDVWKRAVSDDLPTSFVGQPRPSLPPPPKGITAYRLGRCVQNVLDNEGDFMDMTKISRMRMREYIETPAFLVCCAGVEVGSFGEVAEVLSKVGKIEKTNYLLTIESNPLFTVRWTCLSLVAIRQKVTDKGVQQLAALALDAIAYFQTNLGSQDIMTMALTSAQKMDDDLKKAWEAVLDLRMASASWSQNHDRAGSEIRGILQGCESSIQELANITTDSDAVGLEDIDWRIRFLQETMDGVTRKLTRRLPGVFFDELHRTAPITINEAFYIPPITTTPILPQLIYPGQQLQNICTLGRRLRDITERQDTEVHEETLESLEYLRETRNPLGGLDYVMERQVWRLLDLRDGGGLGFTIELFFLALRQLPSASSPSELEKTFYTGTFNVMKSNWKKSKHSAGTQRILLDLVCDLVIPGRGIFSDKRYPSYIVEMLLDLVGKMVEGHEGSLLHVNEVIAELENDGLQNRMNMNIGLRAKALDVICHCANAASS
jgi:uncharacterized protein DUF6535